MVLVGLLILTGGPHALRAQGLIQTLPDFKVAFIGDQGSGSNAADVLQLIMDEGAEMVLHQGDFDYGGNPNEFDQLINDVLGPDFPYFASKGNHDTSAWSGYQQKLYDRLDRITGASCTGDLGVKSSCTYQGLFFILSGVGVSGSGHDIYIRDELAADDSIWSVCSWHKNQNAMQVGGKGNDVGWGPYEECRIGGAIIATAHEHSYHRTRTLSSTQTQTVDASCEDDPGTPDPDVCVFEGSTFVFVSGIAGRSIRNQDRCSPKTYPYGCNGEWAKIYTSDQGAKYGALFITFHVDGDPRKAYGYFKNIDGVVIDSFTITAGPQGNQAPTVDAGGDQIIILPATASLNGIVSDDGLPAPPALTTTWSMVSGPGTVTFANPGSVNSTASFPAAGTYVLRLTANDGELSYSDEVTITGLPGGTTNQPPSVSAGPDQTITLTSSASLDGTATDDGLPNPPGTVSTTWSKVNGPGTVTFGDATAMDTTASFSTAGTYVLRLTADDSALTATNDVSVTVYPAPQGLDIRVAASSDDAEESSSGSVNLTSSDLELIQESSAQTVGMRFNSVAIPVGATIALATIQFKVDETTSTATSLTIQGEATNNAPTFTSSSGNISSRARTSASVAWSPAPWPTTGATGPDQQTPNFAAIVQEVVDQPGWASGNSLVVIITGTGKRVAESFNGDSAGAALLHVEFTTGPPPNTAPVASAVAITGTAEVGQVLTGTYTYNDADSDAEGTSTYRWLRDTAEITGATTTSYTLVAVDQGENIKFKVTPIQNHILEYRYKIPHSLDVEWIE